MNQPTTKPSVTTHSASGNGASRASSGRRDAAARSSSNPRPASVGQGEKAAYWSRVRTGISADHCHKIWWELGDPNPKKTSTLNGNKQRLGHYERAKKPHFGMAIQWCVLFNGRLTLPYDHPNHDEELRKEVENLVPPSDKLFSKGNTTQTLSHNLRKAVLETIDANPTKLERFDFKRIILDAKNKHRKLQRQANGSPKNDDASDDDDRFCDASEDEVWTAIWNERI